MLEAFELRAFFYENYLGYLRIDEVINQQTVGVFVYRNKIKK